MKMLLKNGITEQVINMSEVELENHLDELESRGFVILSVRDTEMCYEVWYHDGVEETTELIPKGCIINR